MRYMYHNQYIFVHVWKRHQEVRKWFQHRAITLSDTHQTGINFTQRYYTTVERVHDLLIRRHCCRAHMYAYIAPANLVRAHCRQCFTTRLWRHIHAQLTEVCQGGQVAVVIGLEAVMEPVGVGESSTVYVTDEHSTHLLARQWDWQNYIFVLVKCIKLLDKMYRIPWINGESWIDFYQVETSRYIFDRITSLKPNLHRTTDMYTVRVNINAYVTKCRRTSQSTCALHQNM